MTVRPKPRWLTWIVSIGLLRTELHAPKRSRIRRLPYERAMGRSAKSASPAIRATETWLPDSARANAHPTGPPPAMATSTSASSATADQSLEVPDRFRRGRSQYLAPRNRHDDVVLDAYPGVPELPWHVIGRPDVAARLYGQCHEIGRASCRERGHDRCGAVR